MYILWIRIDDMLPWLELKGEYRTRKEALKAAREALDNAMIDLVEISEESKRVEPLRQNIR